MNFCKKNWTILVFTGKFAHVRFTVRPSKIAVKKMFNPQKPQERINHSTKGRIERVRIFSNSIFIAVMVGNVYGDAEAMLWGFSHGDSGKKSGCNFSCPYILKAYSFISREILNLNQLPACMQMFPLPHTHHRSSSPPPWLNGYLKNLKNLRLSHSKIACVALTWNSWIVMNER